MLTPAQRTTLASNIIDAMVEQYKSEGIGGDFADAKRYLANDVSEQELLHEADRWGIVAQV